MRLSRECDYLLAFDGHDGAIGQRGVDTVGVHIIKCSAERHLAEMALFPCSAKAGFITGENICIDGGMTKLMIYHGEHGWRYAD